VEGVVEIYDYSLDTEIREETIILAQMINKHKALTKLLQAPLPARNVDEMKSAYTAAKKEGDPEKVSLAEANLKEAVIFNDRQEIRRNQDQLKLNELQITIDQSRELIGELKKQLEKSKQTAKIKYIPCKIWEAQNIQEGRYFDQGVLEVVGKKEDLTPEEYLLVYKCVRPTYTPKDVKLLKPDIMKGIIKCIQRGSGLYDFTYRQLLLEAIASKKKKTIPGQSEN
jgi:hypothetical protein